MTLNGSRSSPLIQLLDWIFRPLDFLEKCDRKIRPKRRGATVAPENGVPLIINGKRDLIERSMTLSEYSFSK